MLSINFALGWCFIIISPKIICDRSAGGTIQVEPWPCQRHIAVARSYLHQDKGFIDSSALGQISGNAQPL